jgi:hypothetical protein
MADLVFFIFMKLMTVFIFGQIQKRYHNIVNDSSEVKKEMSVLGYSFQ